MADFDPVLSRFDRPPVPDDDLDRAVRATLKPLSEQARFTDQAPPGSEIRALGHRRRRRRIAGSAALAGTTVLIAVIIALTGTSAASSSLVKGSPRPHTFVGTVSSSELAPNPADDIGYLSAAQIVGGHLIVTFDRVVWLTDPAAVTANGGVEPPKGHLIVNNNRRLRTLAVDDGARLFGNRQLGGHRSPQSILITPSRLVERTTAAVGARGRGPLVRLVHHGGADGRVIRLEEIASP